MSSLIHLKRPAAAVILVIVAVLAGCRSESDSFAPTPDLDAEIARASALRQAILVLVTESGQSRADDRARALFNNIIDKGEAPGIVPVLLDLSVSRNRAMAARFHVTDTPLLVGLSPMGLIVSRDQAPLTKELIRSRIAVISQRGPELDAKFASLEDAAARDENNATAQLALADFLLSQENAREAIPPLAAVAHSEAADPVRRVRAWVELARSHLWIAEPEKARHEATDLIAMLGPAMAEARAGGNLVLGMQDAKAKRIALARRELETAIAAAPDSEYAKQAAEELAKLPGEGK